MKNKVLFLASWYPSKVDAYDGDFIERHAQSASLFNQVFVVYLVKDPSIKNGKSTVDQQISGNLISYKGYYPYSGFRKGLIEKLHSNFLAKKLFIRIFKTILNDYGMPDVVHLNVLMKAGLFAWYLKKKYKLPYVLSENWTGYYPERKDGFRQQSFLYKYLSKKIYKHCDLPLPVTNDLGQKMNQLFRIEKSFKVIPNVVNTDLFYPPLQTRNGKKRFIHASTLGYHKNIIGILNAIEKLFKKRNDFEIYLAGEPSDEIIKWTIEHGLKDSCIFFTGVISYKDVAENFRKADALVMFSRYENLPCVILEALCTGLPVITTDVGGIREVIDEENGILLNSENENELLSAMDFMLDHLDKFDKKKIADNAKEKFNYHFIGMEFEAVYKQVISQKNSQKN